MNGDGGEKFIRLVGDKNQIVRAQQGERKVNDKMYMSNQSKIEIQTK